MVADYSNFPYPYPQTRYTQWTELENDVKTNAKNLGYNRNLWDNLELLELEAFPYDDLTAEEIPDVLTLGLDEDVWNCFINHYNGYYWDDLVEEGVVEYYEILGWTERMWDDEVGTPDTDDFYWYELSAEEQEAANSLCFIANSWDWVSLADW